MNWEAVAAIAEGLGAVGVIVTLAYLATQIRQNSKLLRASTAGVTLAGSQNVSGILAQNPDLTRIWFAGMADRSALDESDRQRFDPLATMSFGVWHQEYQYSRDGVMSERVWERTKRAMSWLLQQPGIQQWWAEWQKTYDDDFIAFVDGLIRDGEAAE